MLNFFWGYIVGMIATVLLLAFAAAFFDDHKPPR